MISEGRLSDGDDPAGQAAEPEESGQHPARVATVTRAARGWKNELIDTTGNNRLLYYKSLRRGTIELTPESIGSLRVNVVDQLLASQAVRLSQLVSDPEELVKVASQARSIASKSAEAFEERGLHTLYLAAGLARGCPEAC